MFTVYWDIDGVINPDDLPSASSFSGWRSGSYRESVVSQLKASWSADLIDRINRLSRRDDIDMRWLTSWGDEAYAFGATAGVRQGVMRGTSEENFDSRNEWWKLDVIEDHVHMMAEGDSIVWIDDSILTEPGTVTWLADHQIVRWISPDPDIGFTRSEWETLENLLAT